MKARAFMLSLALALVGFAVCFPVAVLVLGSFMDNAELASVLKGVVVPGTGEFGRAHV